MSDGYFNRYMEVSLECDRLKDRISSLEHTLAAVQRDAEVALEQRRDLEREIAEYHVHDERRRKVDEITNKAIGLGAMAATAAAKERDSALAQLAEVRGECERMRTVYEAALVWHREDRAMECGDDPASGARFRDAWDALNAAVDNNTSPPRSGDE